MNRFIVNLGVWHDDIRTNHEVVFTQPRPEAVIVRVEKGNLNV